MPAGSWSLVAGTWFHAQFWDPLGENQYQLKFYVFVIVAPESRAKKKQKQKQTVQISANWGRFLLNLTAKIYTNL